MTNECSSASNRNKKKKKKRKAGQQTQEEGELGKFTVKKKVRQLMWIMRYKSTIKSFGAHRGAYGYRATRPEDPIHQ